MHVPGAPRPQPGLEPGPRAPFLGPGPAVLQHLRLLLMSPGLGASSDACLGLAGDQQRSPGSVQERTVWRSLRPKPTGSILPSPGRVEVSGMFYGPLELLPVSRQERDLGLASRGPHMAVGKAWSPQAATGGPSVLRAPCPCAETRGRVPPQAPDLCFQRRLGSSCDVSEALHTQLPPPKPGPSSGPRGVSSASTCSP